MRKGLARLSLALAVIVLSAGNVYSDITPISSLQSTVSLISSNTEAKSATYTVRTSLGVNLDGLKSDVQPLCDLERSSGSADSDAKEAEVRDLPAGPDSVVLFLSALGSLGVFHAGKSAKKLNLAFAPDWYHSGGLRQVGHAHALDLDFYLVTMPAAAFFVQPAPDEFSKANFQLNHDIADRSKAQFCLPPQAPRGPPSIS